MSVVDDIFNVRKNSQGRLMIDCGYPVLFIQRRLMAQTV